MLRQCSCKKLLLLFIALFFVMLSSDLSWAQAISEETPILAPVQSEIDGKSQISFVEIENSKNHITSLNELRQALQQEAYHEQMKNQFNGPVVSATKRFGPESLTFFLANGLIITETMWSKGFSDPMAMERHILSLKDPVAHLSFYAFMQANGIFMYRKSKSIVDLDPQMKAQKMRLFSYGGLVWGSLASSLVADVFSPYKPCLNKLFSKDYRFTKFNEEECKASLDSAYKQWTIKKKFNQYAPQIISLVISQEFSEVLDVGVKSGLNKISKSELIGAYLRSKTDRIIFKITAADVGLTFLPSGIALKSIRWLGKLTQFTVFMAIDHGVSAPIYRAFNNLWKPLVFDFDVVSFNSSWSLADEYGWDLEKAESDKIKCPVQNEKCLSFSDFPKKIENFTREMQDWRQHLNSDNEQHLYGWMELTKKILNQVELSYSFYKTFANNLFDTLNIGHRIQNNQNVNINVMPMFPYRTFPLYGVIFETKSDVSIEDQYLLSPQHLEKYQLKKVYDTVIKFSPFIQQLSSKKSQNFLQNVFVKLSSTDLSTIASGLQDLNKISGHYGRLSIERTLNGQDPQLTKLALQIRNELGNPEPKLQQGQGFATAFSTNSAFLETAREANFKWNGRNFSFKNDGDYLFYQMLCGPRQGLITDNILFTDNFVAPSILKPDAKPDFCTANGSYLTSENLYGIKIDNQHKFIEYLIKNLNYNTIGDYRDSNTKNQFDTWWQKNVKEVINSKFKTFDQKYQQLVEKTYERIFSPTTIIDKLNQSRYLPKTLFSALQWEMQVYVNLLSSLGNANPKIKNINYLEASKQLNSLYGNESEKVLKIRQSYLNYLELLKKNEIRFEDYSAIKTEIDDSLENFKAELQLKSKVQEEALAKTLIGLASVESEIRRFLRMKILLSQTLEMDTKEFIADINSQQSQKPKRNSAINPRGGF